MFPKYLVFSQLEKFNCKPFPFKKQTNKPLDLRFIRALLRAVFTPSFVCSDSLLHISFQRFLLAHISSCCAQIWVNLLPSFRSMLFFVSHLYCSSEVTPLSVLSFSPHWCSVVFQPLDFFPLAVPFIWFDFFCCCCCCLFGHNCKPGGIQFLIAVWMETLVLWFFYFIRLAYVEFSFMARIMYSEGFYWCINSDNRSSWGSTSLSQTHMFTVYCQHLSFVPQSTCWWWIEFFFFFF